ncbi:o-succinylbenzoate synthase [Saccharopolyspora sp. NPDC002686]|uniref:o-succinylbenzoate synthase n=1 Tax=Saccharopolyspora sp. NPDC002686 TaxID=3154541 RepID=UPI00332CFA9C
MMKIASAALHRVRLPLKHSFQTSSHRKDHLEHVLVQLVDESGAVGWGEIASPSDPYYASDTVETSWTVATGYLLPAILGREVEHPSRLGELYGKVRGHRFAAAGIDAAGWALWTAQQGVPLARALGGERETVVAGVSLGIEPTIDELLEQVQRQVDAGYPRVKLKIAPGWDVEPVKQVRAAFPELNLHVDANGAYLDIPEHRSVLRELDNFELAMIEQPFAPRALLPSAELQASIETPVCLDESVDTLDDLRTAIALKAARILNIKASRMGGLTTAVAAHDLAREAGWPVWCGGMHEFGIGRIANVALSSLPGFSLPSDVSASEKYYARDVVNPPLVAHAGVVAVPTTPGLGVEVDEDFIAQHSHQTHRKQSS